MEEGSRSPTLHLDLNNFEDGQGSRYVLTSPRSLEACARLGIRPVDLLHKSREEVMEEFPGASMKMVADMHRSHEKERRMRVLMCRELRTQLIEDEEMERKQRESGTVTHPLTSTITPTDWWEDAQNRHRGASQARTGGDPTTMKPTDCLDHTKTKHKEIPQARRAVQPNSLKKSRSLEDLKQPELQVRQLARKLERECRVSVSERDKKIAALMLLRHKEKEMSKQRKLEAEQAWEEVKTQERSFKDVLNQYEKLDYKTKKMINKSLKDDRDIDALLNLSAHKTQLKKGLVKAGNETERTHNSERETPSLLPEEKVIQALKTKMIRELQSKENIRMKNQYEMLRHSQRKEKVDNQAKAEELFKKMSIQQKEEKAQELHGHMLEQRNQELKERASREEEQILLAKIRAERQKKEQMKHKKMLVLETNRKIRHAKDSQEKNIKYKAERTRELNIIKEKTHQFLKQKVNEEEEIHRKAVEQQIRIKDRKSDKLLMEREATIEEGKRIARASFHMREAIREKTKSRTFDQMALQAQLNASLVKFTL
ncbi:coiled-coil domain-containing protein 185 [Spea bombifrons]|uniref:coiled-coil domain-containing protein 185 n=1 Tax=Spea bombifrons TaxID=233779 RepID=UPI00234B2880|nr:coiled-coil domain-containing protein 185 [Spea bombifrons]